MAKRVLVYGWYHQNNLGDDMFAEAFRYLLPEISFTFTNCIMKSQVAACDALIFGGGSFLDNVIRAEAGALDLVGSKPILYVGVGLDTKIHSDHQTLLERSELVAARSDSQKVRGAILVPDLVYSLPVSRCAQSPNSVLFIPNVSVLPSHSDPYWMHASWSYFKSECSQFLDELISDGFSISFLPLCRSQKLDDMWAIGEIVASMNQRHRDLVVDARIPGSVEAVSFISRFSHVVTQRFHGAVLADLAGCKSVVVSHHSKLNLPGSVPFYGVNKSVLRSALESSPSVRTLPTRNDFADVCTRIRQIIGSS